MLFTQNRPEPIAARLATLCEVTDNIDFSVGGAPLKSLFFQKDTPSAKTRDIMPHILLNQLAVSVWPTLPPYFSLEYILRSAC